MTKTLIKKQLMEVFAWLYMALMGIVSVTLGVFGSVFNTFSTLYQVRDNDLLFAMPITERSVLTARLSGVYAMGLMYELFVLGSDMFSGLPTIMKDFFLCYGDETPGSVEPFGEHDSCFVGGSSECLAQGNLQ